MFISVHENSQQWVYLPPDPMQLTHRRLTDMAYRWRNAWGMASHSCWSRPRRAGSVAGGGWFSRTCLSRWSQKCSIGLRSGLQAGQSILTTPDPGIPPTIRHVSETSVCRLHGVRRRIYLLLTVFMN